MRPIDFMIFYSKLKDHILSDWFIVVTQDSDTKPLNTDSLPIVLPDKLVFFADVMVLSWKLSFCGRPTRLSLAGGFKYFLCLP